MRRIENILVLSIFFIAALIAIISLCNSAHAYNGGGKWRPINRMSHFFAQNVSKPAKGSKKVLKPCVTCGRKLWLPKKKEQCSVCNQMQGSMPTQDFLLHLWQISQNAPWDKPRGKEPGR